MRVEFQRWKSDIYYFTELDKDLVGRRKQMLRLGSHLLKLLPYPSLIGGGREVTDIQCRLCADLKFHDVAVKSLPISCHCRRAIVLALKLYYGGRRSSMLFGK